eukprot:TRINITY_DN93881_c0_g1_i1.p1 TRINITY_DN93881_c0_g1~~TRINITY_DN93881_c0_g1_i1.p1  ORF type:complete len:517 (-),score=110.42 TRINITY_DN93881_c0_g1_i1:129-1679(-)
MLCSSLPLHALPASDILRPPGLLASSGFLEGDESPVSFVHHTCSGMRLATPLLGDAPQGAAAMGRRPMSGCPRTPRNKDPERTPTWKGLASDVWRARVGDTTAPLQVPSSAAELPSQSGASLREAMDSVLDSLAMADRLFDAQLEDRLLGMKKPPASSDEPEVDWAPRVPLVRPTSPVERSMLVDHDRVVGRRALRRVEVFRQPDMRPKTAPAAYLQRQEPVERPQEEMRRPKTAAAAGDVAFSMSAEAALELGRNLKKAFKDGSSGSRRAMSEMPAKELPSFLRSPQWQPAVASSEGCGVGKGQRGDILTAASLRMPSSDSLGPLQVPLRRCRSTSAHLGGAMPELGAAADHTAHVPLTMGKASSELSGGRRIRLASKPSLSPDAGGRLQEVLSPAASLGRLRDASQGGRRGTGFLPEIPEAARARSLSASVSTPCVGSPARSLSRALSSQRSTSRQLTAAGRCRRDGLGTEACWTGYPPQKKLGTSKDGFLREKGASFDMQLPGAAWVRSCQAA